MHSFIAILYSFSILTFTQKIWFGKQSMNVFIYVDLTSMKSPPKYFKVMVELQAIGKL